MSAEHPRPIRDDDESPAGYMARLIAWQNGMNDDHLLGATGLPPKVCGSCNHSNGAAAKKCSECGHDIGLSMTPNAIKCRKRRLDAKLAKEEAARKLCLICHKSLANPKVDLGISLCVVRSNEGGQTRSRILPCGRQMHLKCLKKQLKASMVRNGEFGLQRNKCANCQQKTKEPHYIPIYGP